jgi:uncharacterized membrane protein
MEFVALLVLVLSIVAIAIALQLRSRVWELERRIGQIDRWISLRGVGAPAAPPPIPTTPSAPLTVEPAGAPAQLSERLEEAAADKVNEAAPPPPPPLAPPPPPPPLPPAAAPARSFEERFGASWVVWIGGVALALGGIFLVQYSIEAGLIGPAVRVFLGGLLAAALIAGGEWTRRREFSSGLANIPTAHIPSILTAAGTTVAFATIYAAYAVYGFLSPAAAFILLGIVALATLAASLLHGPWLAALGQVGAFVVPALVASDTPNYWALYIYLAVVTAASFALARARLWRWLVITAVAFGTLWMLVGISDTRADVIAPHAFQALASFVLAALLIVSGLFYGPEAEDGRIDPISSGALAASLFGAAVLTLAQQHDALALTAFTLLAVATVAIAWRTEAAAAAVPVAGALAALVIADWAVDIQWRTLVAPGGPTAGLLPEPQHAFYGPQLALGGAFAALFGGAGFLAQGRSSRLPIRAEVPIIWAATAVVVPLAILIALYYRIYGFERALPFAALALGGAALFAVATELLTRHEPRPGAESAAAIFATGALAALALTLTFALEKGWLTVALALLVPGVAWIARQRPLPWLRWLAAIVAGLVVARIGYEPRIVVEAGAAPIFNWILYGYGVPALAFWVAGYILRKRFDDVPSRIVDAAAIVFTALTFCLEVRHYLHGGDIYWRSADLAELATQVVGALAFAIGLERLRARSGSIVHNVAAIVFAALALATIVFGLLLIENPWIWSTDVGGLFVNLNLLGYAVPAALAAALGLITRPTRPDWYRAVAAITAVVLAIAYLSLEVARFYQGPRLSIGPISGAEGYTYSAVWLGFGVILLIVGILLRSQPVRLASAAVVLLTVGKVFLLDMAGLTGVWRAFSFIGLGLVLVGIGYLYQRLLFARRPPAEPSEEQQR